MAEDVEEDYNSPAIEIDENLLTHLPYPDAITQTEN